MKLDYSFDACELGKECFIMDVTITNVDRFKLRSKLTMLVLRLAAWIAPITITLYDLNEEVTDEREEKETTS